MTFVEWYEETYKHNWRDDYVLLGGYVQEVEDEYNNYCHKEYVEPIWNG